MSDTNNINQLVRKLRTFNEKSLEISSLNKKSNILRKDRSNLESDIIADIKSMSLETKKLRIADTSFFLGEQKEKPILNVDLIALIAKNMFGEQQSQRLINNINDYREQNKNLKIILKNKQKRKPTRSSLSQKRQTDLKVNSDNHHSLKKKI